MRLAVIPLIMSATLRALEFVLVRFAQKIVFFFFPASLYCLLATFLMQGVTVVA